MPQSTVQRNATHTTDTKQGCELALYEAINLHIIRYMICIATLVLLNVYIV